MIIPVIGNIINVISSKHFYRTDLVVYICFDYEYLNCVIIKKNMKTNIERERENKIKKFNTLGSKYS